ncbi:hypothetical protein SNE40_009585 [Patella caerulea]|uniref:DUF6570 domain-containing protein n=1 Tax=Patella caerulea TaxID=87958 RepID=A0AAN8JPZ2_PATCE
MIYNQYITVSLYKGAQHGLKGQVVLVPSDLTKVTTNLPRATSNSQIITLALKRRLSNKHAVHKQCIRPQYVNNAIKYLKTHSPLYSDVTIKESWESDSARSNGYFWTSVVQNPLLKESQKPVVSLSTNKQNTGAKSQEDDDLITDSEDEPDNQIRA